MTKITLVSNIKDVAISSPSTGQVLTYSGGMWRNLNPGATASGGGDMYKSVYDTDNDGVVDNSEALQGHPDTYFATSTHTHTMSGGHIIQDEGVSLTQRTKLNFVGSGVTVTDDSANDRTNVTIAVSGTTSGGGDMYKSVYDTNNNGIVDNSEKLGNQLPAYYSISGHVHDDRYYTETELQTSGQAAVTWGNIIGKPTIGHTIRDEGVSLTQRTYLNFVGTGVTVTDSAGTDTTTVTISGGTTSSGGGHTIQDEGSGLTQRTNLNFVGAGVTVTDDGANNATKVTIPSNAGYDTLMNMGSALTKESKINISGLMITMADNGVNGRTDITVSESEWINISSFFTCTCNASSQLLIQTDRWGFTNGTKIRLWQGGVQKFFYVIGVTYSAPNTILTLDAGSDYTLTSSAPSNVYYSLVENPMDFPQWFNYTPSLVGWSSNPPNNVYRYKLVGQTCYVVIRQATQGTSNSTSTTISAPLTALTLTNAVWFVPCIGRDNGANLAIPSEGGILSGGNTFYFYKDCAGSAWTNPGGKCIQAFHIFYEIEMY